jgi:hypothetical protein
VYYGAQIVLRRVRVGTWDNFHWKRTGPMSKSEAEAQQQRMLRRTRAYVVEYAQSLSIGLPETYEPEPVKGLTDTYFAWQHAVDYARFHQDLNAVDAIAYGDFYLQYHREHEYSNPQDHSKVFRSFVNDAFNGYAMPVPTPPSSSEAKAQAVILGRSSSIPPNVCSQ